MLKGKLVKLLFSISWPYQVLISLASFAVLKLIFNWEFILIIALMLIPHEFGHFLAARFSGANIKIEGFYFLVGFGGLLYRFIPPFTAGVVVFVLAMGSFTGLIAALLSFYVFLLTADTLWAFATCLLIIINLFNLLPLKFLDGYLIFQNLDAVFPHLTAPLKKTISIIIIILIVLDIVGCVGLLIGSKISISPIFNEN